MFKLGPETEQALCQKTNIKPSTFSSQYGMYFHTKDYGKFVLNLGKEVLKYPYNQDDQRAFNNNNRSSIDLIKGGLL